MCSIHILAVWEGRAGVVRHHVITFFLQSSSLAHFYFLAIVSLPLHSHDLITDCWRTLFTPSLNDVSASYIRKCYPRFGQIIASGVVCADEWDDHQGSCVRVIYDCLLLKIKFSQNLLF